MAFWSRNNGIIGSGVILAEIYKKAQEKGFVNNKSVITIPELNMQANHVTANIFNYLADLFESNGQSINVEIISTFCMFAGIGSILLWDKDWTGLSSKGIFESLIAPKGVDAIDDYVMELMGFEDTNYSTSKNAMRMKVMGQFLTATAMEIAEDNIEKIEQFQQIIIAMFNFGVAYGAELLGMK